MKNKNNLQNNSTLQGLNQIVNSNSDASQSRIPQSNYIKRDLTISNSTQNLTHTIQQYQQQLSSQASQQGNSSQRSKYFLNNSSNGLIQQNGNSSIDKKQTVNQNYFLKSGISNQSSSYLLHQNKNQQKSFDNVQRPIKNDQNSSALSNRIKTSRSIVSYNMPESNKNKQLSSSHTFSPISMNQVDQSSSLLKPLIINQENPPLKNNNNSKSPSSIRNNILNSNNNIINQTQKQTAPINKSLTQNVNLSNIFKSSNSNHLIRSNPVKNQNSSLTNISGNLQLSNQNIQNSTQTNSNNENKIQSQSYLVREESKNNGYQKASDLYKVQRTERSETTYEQTDPKKQKIVENIIENILNTEESVQEINTQMGIYVENRNLLNRQKKLVEELENIKNANSVIIQENQELKEYIKKEREKFKEEFTKQENELNNLRQCEDLYKQEKNINEKYRQNLKELEEIILNYKNDIVGLIYDAFEIVLISKGFNTHLMSVKISIEETIEGISNTTNIQINIFLLQYQVYRFFQRSISKKSSDLMHKLNPFVIDLNIEEELKNFGNIIRNDQKIAFFQNLQVHSERNNSCMHEIPIINRKDKQSIYKDTNEENIANQQDFLIKQEIFDLQVSIDEQDQSELQVSEDLFVVQNDYEGNNQLEEYTKIQNQNENNEKKKSSIQEICYQNTQDQYSISSQRNQHKNSQQENCPVILQDYISFSTNDKQIDGQNQIINTIEESDTPSKSNQNPLDQFVLISSCYKPQDFQLDIPKEQVLFNGIEDENKINGKIQINQNINSSNQQQNYSNQQDTYNMHSQNNQSHFNLMKQMQIQPKNFTLQLVSSDKKNGNSFDQIKQLQDQKNIGFNSKNLNDVIQTIKEPQSILSYQLHSQLQCDPINKFQDMSLINSSSAKNNYNNSSNVLNGSKQQTDPILKSIGSCASNQKSLSNSTNTTKHKNHESIESQSNDVQMSSGQNTVIYHHSKQVSQLSSNVQSNQKNLIQNYNNFILNESDNFNSGANQNDKEIDVLELSPCFSSSRVNDLENSNSMNPLDIYKKQNQQTKNLVQNKHLNQNSIHYHPNQQQQIQQISEQIILQDNIYSDKETTNHREQYQNNKQDNLKKTDNQIENKISKENVKPIEEHKQNQKNEDVNEIVQNTMLGDEFVIAQYDYKAQKENDLEFKKGDKIQVLKRTTNGWWIGLCRNHIGYFPFNFVSEIKFS